MEQILREIYREQTMNLRQRRRIDNLLQNEDKIRSSSQRKQYYFPEKYTNPTPPTQLTIDDQIRFQKQFYETQKRIEPKQVKRSYKIKLKKAISYETETKPNVFRKFRAAVHAVIFLNHLRSKYRNFLLLRKRQCEKCSRTLLMRITGLVKSYYEKLLEEQLKTYMRILEESIQSPTINQEKALIQLLYYMAQKLSNSTVTKDILHFLICISTEHGFPPSDFLTIFQINKLQFSAQYGCLINVSQQQTKMVVGLALGIKIFCFYVLFQPWVLTQASQTIKNVFILKQGSAFLALKQTVSKIGFCFYHLILEQSKSLKQINQLDKNRLEYFGIRPIKQLDPFNEKENERTYRHVILGYDKQYLSSMESRYPKLVNSSREFLLKWIHRITYACLKTSETNKKNLTELNSTAYRTIDTNKGSKHNTHVFKSLELKRSSLKKHRENSVAFPPIKRTIQ